MIGMQGVLRRWTREILEALMSELVDYLRFGLKMVMPRTPHLAAEGMIRLRQGLFLST